jgi:hypothetical protein
MKKSSAVLAVTSLLAIAALSACNKNEAPPPAAADHLNEPASAPASIPRTPSPAGARVFIITPADGATVSSPVLVEFGVEGMAIVPAGTAHPDAGHHHLLVDTDVPALDQPIPKDANHIHFGDGSASVELNLEPGAHTLQLLLADHAHIPHDPPVVSEKISITIQ